MSDRLAEMARNPPPGARLTYRSGLGDPGATLTDCPRCGQAVRLELYGWRLSATCYGGCTTGQLADALEVPRLAAELGACA